jgi:hypothetical protein
MRHPLNALYSFQARYHRGRSIAEIHGTIQLKSAIFRKQGLCSAQWPVCKSDHFIESCRAWIFQCFLDDGPSSNAGCTKDQCAISRVRVRHDEKCCETVVDDQILITGSVFDGFIILSTGQQEILNPDFIALRLSITPRRTNFPSLNRPSHGNSEVISNCVWVARICKRK